jgi:hypothetical protein
MANGNKSTPKIGRVRNKPYLTKRRLSSAARAGIRIAAARTMSVMGYNIIAQDGWVVKKYPNGNVSKIKQFAKQQKNVRFTLD